MFLDDSHIACAPEECLSPIRGSQIGYVRRGFAPHSPSRSLLFVAECRVCHTYSYVFKRGVLSEYRCPHINADDPAIPVLTTLSELGQLTATFRRVEEL